MKFSADVATKKHLQKSTLWLPRLAYDGKQMAQFKSNKIVSVGILSISEDFLDRTNLNQTDIFVLANWRLIYKKGWIFIDVYS